MRESTREKRYIAGSKRMIPAKKKKRGVPTEPSKAMVTVRGSKVHFKGKPSGKPASKLNTFALCGAGSPNQEFPTGSSQFFEREDIYQGKPQWVIVDCYKCIKLGYANRMIEANFGKEIPQREFVPSDQHPTHWGYKATAKEITQLLTNAPKRVKNAVVKGNTIVVYFHEKGKTGQINRKGHYDGDGDYNTRWYALNLSQQNLTAFQSLLARNSIPWQNVKAPKAGGYDRRKMHVMVPFGREGMFGGDVENKQGENAEDMLESMGLQGDEFLEGGNWPKEYFRSPFNKWKVGAIPQQRTQQRQKDPTLLFRPWIFDLLNAKDYKALSAKDQARFQKLQQHMYDFYQFLIGLPKGELAKIRGQLRSYTALQIWKQASAHMKTQQGSYLKTRNPKRVPQLLEKMHRFDTMLNELEGANAQSRRSSLRKR